MAKMLLFFLILQTRGRVTGTEKDTQNNKFKSNIIYLNAFWNCVCVCAIYALKREIADSKWIFISIETFVLSFLLSLAIQIRFDLISTDETDNNTSVRRSSHMNLVSNFRYLVMIDFNEFIKFHWNIRYQCFDAEFFESQIWE